MKPLFHGLVSLTLLSLIALPVWASLRGEDDLLDDRSSEGKAGIPVPRFYYDLLTPPYLQYDFETFSDYGRKAYTPYAQLQINRTLQIGGLSLKPGYYLVKLDVVDYPDPEDKKTTDPKSKNYTPVPLTKEPPPKETTGMTFEDYQTQVNPSTANQPGQNKDTKWRERHFPKFFSNQPKVTPADPEHPETHKSRFSMVIVNTGKVEIVVPVQGSTTASKKHRRSQAEMVIEPGNTLKPEIVYLRYCLKKYCYRSATLEPGLIQ